MNGTEMFLGGRDELRGASVEQRGVHRLWGGTNLRLTGDGLLLLQVVRVAASGLEERCYARQLPDGVARVWEAIVKGDFINIKLSNRTGLPDEARIRIILANSAGEECTVEGWEQTTQSPDSYGKSDRKLFGDVRLALRRLRIDTEEQETPLYEGAYRKDGWQNLCANPPPLEPDREPDARSTEEGPPAKQAPPVEEELPAGTGSIRLSGGCEVYAEGTILFLPGAAGMEVRVENNESNPWFLDTRGDPCRPIRTVPPPEVLDGFFARFRAVIEAGNPPESVSTRDAHVRIRLPLPDGTIEADWREIAAEQDVDTLVDVIESFVDGIVGNPGAS